MYSFLAIGKIADIDAFAQFNKLPSAVARLGEVHRAFCIDPYYYYEDEDEEDDKLMPARFKGLPGYDDLAVLAKNKNLVTVFEDRGRFYYLDPADPQMDDALITKLKKQYFQWYVVDKAIADRLKNQAQVTVDKNKNYYAYLRLTTNLVPYAYQADFAYQKFYDAYQSIGSPNPPLGMMNAMNLLDDNLHLFKSTQEIASAVNALKEIKGWLDANKSYGIVIQQQFKQLYEEIERRKTNGQVDSINLVGEIEKINKNKGINTAMVSLIGSVPRADRGSLATQSLDNDTQFSGDYFTKITTAIKMLKEQLLKEVAASIESSGTPDWTKVKKMQFLAKLHKEVESKALAANSKKDKIAFIQGCLNAIKNPEEDTHDDVEKTAAKQKEAKALYKTAMSGIFNHRVRDLVDILLAGEIPEVDSKTGKVTTTDGPDIPYASFGALK